MKNKFLGKLILSGVTLATCATTLVTSTYAWYTSNSTVSASQVSSHTSAQSDSSSIYIAAADAYDTDKSVKSVGGYSTLATIKTVADNITLDPVSHLAVGSYTALDGKTAAKNTSLYEFVLRIRTAEAGTAATPIYFSSFDLKNTTDTNASVQTALVSNASVTGDNPTGIIQAGTYNADFLKALKMNVITTNMTNETTLDTESASEKLFALSNYASITDSNIVQDGANAVGYYNSALGYKDGDKDFLKSPEGYEAGTELLPATRSEDGSIVPPTGSALPICTIPTSGYVEVRFVFYLDGWDEYCYDICRKQSFTLDMSFTTESAEAVVFTGTTA